MRYIILSLLFVFSLKADDLQRIESILNDIVELRSDYQECQAKLEDKELAHEVGTPDAMMAGMDRCIENEEKLQKYTRLYEEEKEKNSVLQTQLNIFSGIEPDKKDKEIKKYKKLLKIKDYELIQLSNKIKKLKKSKKKVVEKEICKKIEFQNGDNSFPKLKLKEIYEKEYSRAQKRKTIKPKTLQREEAKKFKAATFRLDYDSVIYDGIDGDKLFVWTKGTSFTSNIKTRSWIKITGYFQKGKWVPSKKEMWIKLSQVSKR